METQLSSSEKKTWLQLKESAVISVIGKVLVAKKISKYRETEKMNMQYEGEQKKKKDKVWYKERRKEGKKEGREMEGEREGV